MPSLILPITIGGYSRWYDGMSDTGSETNRSRAVHTLLLLTRTARQDSIRSQKVMQETQCSLFHLVFHLPA